MTCSFPNTHRSPITSIISAEMIKGMTLKQRSTKCSAEADEIGVDDSGLFNRFMGSCNPR